jgi:hypothetical protein
MHPMQLASVAVSDVRGLVDVPDVAHQSVVAARVTGWGAEHGTSLSIARGSRAQCAEPTRRLRQSEAGARPAAAQPGTQ